MFSIPAASAAIASFGRVAIDIDLAVALELWSDSVFMGLAGGAVAGLLYLILNLLRAPAALDRDRVKAMQHLEAKVKALEVAGDRRAILTRLGELYVEGCGLSAEASKRDPDEWKKRNEDWVTATYEHIAEHIAPWRAATFRNTGSRPAAILVDAPGAIQVEARALHWRLEALRTLLEVEGMQVFGQEGPPMLSEAPGALSPPEQGS
jgi:hypothetical protein